MRLQTSYKTRLIGLNLLPLEMQFELNIIFFVSCLKHLSAALNIVSVFLLVVTLPGLLWVSNCNTRYHEQIL